MPVAPTLNLIGPGRVGRTLGRLIATSTAARILAIHGPESLAEAYAFIGSGEPCPDLARLPPADIWLIAVPDDRIADVAAHLARARVVPPGAVVAHCSGAGAATLLQPLAVGGALIASLHPVYSFADPERAAAGFRGTACALEGDEPACCRLEELLGAIGGVPFRLAPGCKAAYHAALCIASNYLVTLTALARDAARLAGIEEGDSLRLIGGLMRQTLENALALGPEAALTGPIVRGDANTVAKHLATLATNQELAASYRALGAATCRLAAPRLSAPALAGLSQALYVGQEPDRQPER